MFCQLILLTAAFANQTSLDSTCPEDCIVNFGNGLCAIRVEDCGSGTSSVMYGSCFSEPCGCSGAGCNCGELRYEIPVKSAVVIGHQGPPMRNNHDLTNVPTLTMATIGNVVGYADWDVTHLGNAQVAASGGGGNEYYAMFKVKSTTSSIRYFVGMRISDATTGTAASASEDLYANSAGNVVERAVLFTFTENMQQKTFWFHVVGAGTLNNNSGNNSGNDPGNNPGNDPAPAPAPGNPPATDADKVQKAQEPAADPGTNDAPSSR
jgi:hypothetical protein